VPRRIEAGGKLKAALAELERRLCLTGEAMSDSKDEARARMAGNGLSMTTQRSRPSAAWTTRSEPKPSLEFMNITAT
jgi:hypothetical protein